MRFPSIKDVANELRGINANIEGECDIRLQVYPVTEYVRAQKHYAWTIKWGDPSYDTDHRGYWGSGSIPGVVNGVVKRFNSYGLARELLDQAKEQAAY